MITLWTRLVAFVRWCLTCVARRLGLHLIHPRHRKHIHLAVIGLIAYDLIHVGAKIADLGFLLLSLLIEAEDSHPAAPTTHATRDLPEPPTVIPNAQALLRDDHAAVN